MSDQRRFGWGSGRLVSTPLTNAWAIDLDSRDPSIPNLPLETPPGVLGQGGDPAPLPHLGLLLGVGGASPFFSSITSNPTFALQRGSTHFGAALLLTTLAVVSSAVPFVQSAQDNPVRARHQQVQEIRPSLLVTTLALPGFPRGPLSATVNARTQQQQYTLAGSPTALLQTGGTVALPFVQAAQQNPLRSGSGLNGWQFGAPLPRDGGEQPTAAREWPNRFSALKGLVADHPPALLQASLQPLPIGAIEARAPRAVFRVPVALESGPGLWLQSEQRPFAQVDWPNPRRQAQAQPAQGVGAPLPFDGGAKPFLQSDWPNPRGAAAPRQPEQPPRLLGGVLATLPVGDIALPDRFAPARSVVVDAPNLLLGTLAKPIFGSAKPNPTLPVTRALTWISGQPIPFNGGEKPFAQTDWPVPKAASRSAPEWQTFVSEALAEAQPKPFAQTDWQNPLRVTPSTITWVNVRQVPLDGGGKPFYQSDWPNPARPAAHQQPQQAPELLQDELQPLPVGAIELPPARGTARAQAIDVANLLTSTLATGAPVQAAAIANPQRPTFPVALLTFIGLPAIVGQDAFIPVEFPNPPGAAFPQSLRSWSSALPLPHDGGEKPGLQTDWPVPKGPRRPVADFAVGSPFALIRPASCPTPAEIWGYRLEGGFTAGDMLELMSAVLAGKTTIVALGGAAARVEFRAIDDSATRVAADMQASVRGGMTLTPGSAAPATGDGAADFWNYPIEGGYSAAQVLRLLAAVMLGKSTVIDTGGGLLTVTFRSADDSADRVQASVTGSERTSMTLTP